MKQTLETATKNIAFIRKYAADIGRDPDTLQFSVGPGMDVDLSPDTVMSCYTICDFNSDRLIWR